MSGYVLRPQARNDLSHIWAYTTEHWGHEQADRYVQCIVAVCADVAHGRKQIRPGYFKHVAGSHLIFYRRDRASPAYGTGVIQSLGHAPRRQIAAT